MCARSLTNKQTNKLLFHWHSHRITEIFQIVQIFTRLLPQSCSTHANPEKARMLHLIFFSFIAQKMQHIFFRQHLFTLQVCVCAKKKQRKMYLSVWKHANKLCTKSRKTHRDHNVVFTFEWDEIHGHMLQFYGSRNMYCTTQKLSSCISHGLTVSLIHIWQNEPDAQFLAYINANEAFWFPSSHIFRNFKCKCSAFNAVRPLTWMHCPNPTPTCPRRSRTPDLVGLLGIRHGFWNV